MFEKIVIIKDYDGYKDPGIKDVELTRVNGYKTVITKEGEEFMAEHKLKILSGENAKRLLEIADQEDIDIEDILSFLKKFIKKGKGEKEMSNLTNDEKRFNKEEIIVEKYIEKCKSQGIEISYRDAVVASLDRTEPVVKREFTEEEKKEKEDLKKVEEYILTHPRSSYKDAVKVVLGGEEISLEEKLIEEYLEKNPGTSYKEAVLEVLPLLRKEE